MKPPVALKLDDPKAEQVRVSTTQAVTEMQGRPAMGLKVIPSIQLPNLTAVLVPHGLGRAPLFACASFERGATTAGVIAAFPYDGSYDPTQYLKLIASSYGATITVDVLVL